MAELAFTTSVEMVAKGTMALVGIYLKDGTQMPPIVYDEKALLALRIAANRYRSHLTLGERENEIASLPDRDRPSRKC